MARDPDSPDAFKGHLLWRAQESWTWVETSLNFPCSWILLSWRNQALYSIESQILPHQRGCTFLSTGATSPCHSMLRLSRLLWTFPFAHPSLDHVATNGDFKDGCFRRRDRCLKELPTMWVEPHYIPPSVSELVLEGEVYECESLFSDEVSS